jgi:YVTN family beta-propeller protein
MSRFVVNTLFVFLTFALLFGCNNSESPVSVDSEARLSEPEVSGLDKTSRKKHGHIVIANRASGTISVIDVKTDRVSGTYTTLH